MALAYVGDFVCIPAQKWIHCFSAKTGSHVEEIEVSSPIAGICPYPARPSRALLWVECTGLVSVRDVYSQSVLFRGQLHLPSIGALHISCAAASSASRHGRNVALFRGPLSEVLHQPPPPSECVSIFVVVSDLKQPDVPGSLGTAVITVSAPDSHSAGVASPRQEQPTPIAMQILRVLPSIMGSAVTWGRFLGAYTHPQLGPIVAVASNRRLFVLGGTIPSPQPRGNGPDNSQGQGSGQQIANASLCLAVRLPASVTALALDASCDITVAVGFGSGVLSVYEWQHTDVAALFRASGSSVSADIPSPHPIITPLHWHRHAVHAAAWGPDGHVLASGGLEGCLVLWQRGDGWRRRVLPRLRSAVLSIVAAPSSPVFVCDLVSGTAVIDSASHTQTALILSTSRTAASFATSITSISGAHGDIGVVNGASGNITFYSLRRGVAVAELSVAPASSNATEASRRAVTIFAVAPAGDFVVTYEAPLEPAGPKKSALSMAPGLLKFWKFSDSKPSGAKGGAAKAVASRGSLLPSPFELVSAAEVAVSGVIFNPSDPAALAVLIRDHSPRVCFWGQHEDSTWRPLDAKPLSMGTDFPSAACFSPVEDQSSALAVAFRNYVAVFRSPIVPRDTQVVHAAGSVADGLPARAIPALISVAAEPVAVLSHSILATPLQSVCYSPQGRHIFALAGDEDSYHASSAKAHKRKQLPSPPNSSAVLCWDALTSDLVHVTALPSVSWSLHPGGPCDPNRVAVISENAVVSIGTEPSETNVKAANLARPGRRSQICACVASITGFQGKSVLVYVLPDGGLQALSFETLEPVSFFHGASIPAAPPSLRDSEIHPVSIPFDSSGQKLRELDHLWSGKTTHTLPSVARMLGPWLNSLYK